MDQTANSGGGARPESDRRASLMLYAGFLGSMVLLGVLATLFNEQASQVDQSETESVAVLGTAVTVEEPIVTSSTVTTTIAPTTTLAAPTTAAAPTTTTTVAPTTTTSTIPLSDRSLARIEQVFGDIAPKSVTATGNGLFFAQNMMYRHTVTVYDDQGSLLRTLSDRVDFADFGRPELGVARGAPVEAAATSDGRYVYVSNYAMYGPAFGPAPDDSCADSGWDNSFLYRVDTSTLEIDQVIEVGATPKFLAISPDDRYVVVSNWCSFDASIVDTEAGIEIARIDIGRHPRGVAVTDDSSTAYVTQMGGSDIAILPLDDIGRPEVIGLQQNYEPIYTTWDVNLDIQRIEDVGRGPRSVILSPDNQFLYVTLNSEGTVIKVDAETGEVLERVRTGDAPRSMAISGDGEALYVVNYNSDTMSKILTDSFEEVQELDVADKPIGITVDPESSNVWVSHYSGVLQIFEDQ